MKFFANVVNRIFLHYQQSLIGISILGLGVMLYMGKINDTQFGVILTGILGAYKILMAKDPDKIENKPEVKEKEIKP